MTQRALLSVVFSALSLCSFGQSGLSENEKKYLVYTVQPSQEKKSSESSDSLVTENKKEEVDSMNIWFPFHSLCDWQPGMRFMVIPDKKDLVIKTFTLASENRMVSSQTLLHKVMVYDGHDDANGGLHEHVNFVCEETGDRYYYEVPTASFDDYCFTKFGIPTLAYLGDVDSARTHFLGRKMVTVADRYYIDDPKTAEGFVEIRDVKKDTEVEVVAVGVGTRSFPVKLVLREVDNKGKEVRQFFQNVCISKTNCGLRDVEFEISDVVFHTFDGSFKLEDDNLAVHPLYKKYYGQDVYTLMETTATDASGNPVRLPRLSVLTMKKIRSQSKSEYAKVTLYDAETGNTYTKDVLFQNKNRLSSEDPQRDIFVDNLFGLGNLKTMKNVRASVMGDLRNGVVRSGFSADEVRVALGSPTNTGKAGANTVWFYRSASGSLTKKVYFNSKTMKVVRVSQ